MKEEKEKQQNTEETQDARAERFMSRALIKRRQLDNEYGVYQPQVQECRGAEGKACAPTHASTGAVDVTMPGCREIWVSDLAKDLQV